MEHIYDSPFRVEDRAALRYRARLECVIRELAGGERPVDVIDISDRGFRGRCDNAFRKPAMLEIALPLFGDVKARVVWSHDGEFGAEFLTPIDMQALINGSYDEDEAATERPN